jgi:hypothetical protein
MLCLIEFLRCFLFLSVGFQPVHAGGSPSRGRDLPPADMFNSGAPSSPRSSCRCTEYLSRIAVLEGRLSLMKHQGKIALDKASKSCGFMKQISTLEDKLSGLVARIVHLEECDSFLVGIVESVCEMLRCKVSCSLSLFSFTPLLWVNILSCLRYLPGPCW